ncbi:MAG: DUF481 domain-containing protein [Mariniphaga sp.]|nr:DUF481 domain-containing protein [Mariniphaga sp.]
MLSNNLLKLSTDDGGTINIEWDKIDSIFVLNALRIDMSDGRIFYGEIGPSGKTRECILREGNGTTSEIKLWNIVGLLPLRKKVFDRLSGTISSGLSYVKGSDVTQFNFNGNIEYQADKIILQMNYNLILTRESNETTQRQTGGANLYRVLPRNWSILGRALGESNSYFQLDLRTSFGLGGNYFLIRNNKQRLSSGTGLIINREHSGELTQDNLEGIVYLNYMLFLYDSPKITLNVYSDFIPSLNHFGRIRSETNSSINWEIFKDLYLIYSFYNSFDNTPLSGVDVRGDWGITLGLEYRL